jgi:hypothetical protein
MRLIRTDRAREGDLIAGTWNDTYPTPLRLATPPTVDPEHSVRTHAYRLDFTDGTSKVYYGDCDLQLAQRP